MGSIVSYLWWGGQNPDEENPITKLSPRDIYYVRTSWAKAIADPIASGAEILSRFIKEYPETKKLFKSFKDTPLEELKRNRQFQAHSLNIINSLTSIIDNLHQPDLAIVMCEKLGMTHNKQRITEKQFNDIKDVIVKLFINDLHFDDATMKSWTKTVTFIYGHVFTKLEVK